MGISEWFYRDKGINLNVVTPLTVAADTMKFLGTSRANRRFITVIDIIFAKERQSISIGHYGTGNN